jgi:hypothetical protein
MNCEQYKQQLIHDVIVDKINSITLEERLNNLIMLAQNEYGMKLNGTPYIDVIGATIHEPSEPHPHNTI